MEVELDVPDGTEIYVDPLDLTHVLTNLLSNALQAEPSAPRCGQSPERVRGGTELRRPGRGSGGLA